MVVTESGYIKIDSLLYHHGDLGIIEALAVLNTIYSGDYRILEALPSVCVGSHLAMMAMSLVHDGLQFGSVNVGSTKSSPSAPKE